MYCSPNTSSYSSNFPILCRKFTTLTEDRSINYFLCVSLHILKMFVCLHVCYIWLHNCFQLFILQYLLILVGLNIFYSYYLFFCCYEQLGQCQLCIFFLKYLLKFRRKLYKDMFNKYWKLKKPGSSKLNK